MINREKNKALTFLQDILRGVGIGIAFIIPGFSGGTVAAILGVYEKLVGAIADLFRHFKRSFLTLLPIVLGMLLGIAALILPIRWGLGTYPIPTVSLFVGLALGGLPSVTEKLKGGKVKGTHILACVLPLVFAASLSFLPLAGEADLFHLNFGGYLLLVLVGAVGSAALVVPGVSGSMLLLIFGYYGPLVSLLTDHLLRGDRIGLSLAVFSCLAAGLVIGFFGISVLMKFLLKKFPRGTFFAIFGFIIGSIPAVYASTIREADLSALYSQPAYWVVSVLMLLVGVALSLGFSLWMRKRGREGD